MKDSEVVFFVHDINNEISVIHIKLENIKRYIETNISFSKSEVLKRLDTIQERLIELVQNLYSLCEGEKHIDVSNKISENQEKLESKYDIRVILTRKSRFQIDTNEARFNLFLINLVKNAKEANATKIEFRILKHNLIVIDNGSGFPQEVLSMFKQGTTKSSKGENRGHGLLSMKSFCSDNGLQIQISNNLTSEGAMIVISYNN